MKPAESEIVLRQRLGPMVEPVSARRALTLMSAFYEEQRAEDVSLDEDGDMLLFEWGVYHFTGSASFELGITRQFVVTGEDEPYQLHLTLHFTPNDSLRSLKDGSGWCHSPAELPAFRKFVETSAAFRAVADEKPSRVALYFGQC